MKLTPITNPVALRLDTSVGTRIFAGNIMIHGDTGTRNISDVLPPGTTGQLFTRRILNTVTIVFNNVSIPDDVTSFRIPIPDTQPAESHYLGVEIPNISTTERHLLQVAGSNHNFIASTNRSVSGSANWVTTSSWPVTLPGVPA